MNFDLLLVQNYDLFRRFDAHFVSGADLENYWADYNHIAHTVDPVTNDLASARQKKSLVTESRWSQE